MNEGMQAFQRRYIRDVMAINEVNRQVGSIVRYLDTYEVPHEPDQNFLDCEPVTRELVEEVISSVKAYNSRLVNDFNVAQEFRNQLEHEQEMESVLEKSQQFLGSQGTRMSLFKMFCLFKLSTVVLFFSS